MENGEKTGYRCPPKEHRFSSTNQPKKNGRHKGSTLTDILRKLLKKKIKYEDPETKKMVTGKIKDVIVLRYLLNACQGENKAIEGIFDRIDGKVAQPLIGEGFGGDTKIFLITPKERKKNAGRIDTLAI